MQLPTPPTDNLYKFIALSGITLTIVCLAGSFQRIHQGRVEFEKLRGEADLLEEKKAALARRIQALDAKLAHEVQAGGSEAERAFEIKMQLAGEQDALLIAISELGAKINVLRIITNDTRTVTIFAGVGLFIGSLMTFAGFWLWYARVQVFQDRILQEGVVSERPPSPSEDANVTQAASVAAEIDGYVFIPGLREEWRAFTERHRAFLEQFESLRAATNVAFKQVPAIKSEAPFVIYALVRQAAQDFLEILLLASNGYGLAAQKILRGMYERIVTARWLHANPDDATRFLEWEVIQRSKLAQAFHEALADSMSDKQKEECVKAIAEAQPLRSKFMIKDCGKCGTTRINHTWATVDFVTMAKATGPSTSTWLGPAYYEPLNYIHATAAALGKLFQAKGDVMSVEGVHREEAHNALVLGHCLLLNGLDLLSDRSGDKALEAAMKEACAAYEKVWDLKSPPGADSST